MGYWISNADKRDYTDIFTCSECNYNVETPYTIRYKSFDYEYCPHCGAKMEEEIRKHE